jgi:hypothetical protein
MKAIIILIHLRQSLCSKLCIYVEAANLLEYESNNQLAYDVWNENIHV